MPRRVALLRAVNVGGTGKLAMQDLRALCAGLGFTAAQTYLQSGNVVFDSDLPEAEVQARLEAGLRDLCGRPVPVLLRDAARLAALLAENPFPGADPAQLAVLFLPGAPPPDLIACARGRKDEGIVPAAREIFLHYPSGMGKSKLRLPGMEQGTARNLRSVAALAGMAAEAPSG